MGARVIRTVLLVAPIAVIGWICVTGPEIPHNDYWIYLRNIVGDDGSSPTLGGWAARHNNHVLTGAYAVYALNLAVTRGSNLGLTLFSWTCAIGILWVLTLWTRRAVGGESGFAGWLSAIQSWALFSPFLAMYWVLGFSGVHTLGSVLSSLVAIELWSAYRRRRKPRDLVGCALATAVALSFFSSSLALLPILGLAALPELRRGDRRTMALLGVLALVTVLWIAGVSPEAPGRPPVAGKAALLLFPLAVLGSPFTRLVEPALAAGLLAVAGLIGLGLHHLRRTERDEPKPSMDVWWLLAGYAVVNVVMMAATRSSGGLPPAFATRYSVFPVLGWIALAVLAAARLPRLAGRSVAIGLLIATAVGTHVNGLGYLRALQYRADLEPAATLALDLGAVDEQAIAGSITPWVFTFTRMLPALEAHHWVPFDRPRAHLEVGDLDPVDREHQPVTIVGWSNIGASVTRIIGASPDDLPVGAPLALVDAAGETVGRAVVTPGVHHLGDTDARWWVGYVEASRSGELTVVDSTGRSRGTVQGRLRERPIRPDLNPFRSPYPRWYDAGEYAVPALQRWIEPGR